jgi:hypothetical protein
VAQVVDPDILDPGTGTDALLEGLQITQGLRHWARTNGAAMAHQLDQVVVR